MERRRLGRTGPHVSALGLGCMSISGSYGVTDEAETMRLFDRALELGVDHFDTADIYGMGGSEELIGRFLKRERPKVTLASKGGIRYVRATGERWIDNSPAYLRQALENTLLRLGRDHIELYYVHRRDANRPIEETIEALAELKREGKIGGIGLSEVSPDTLRRAHSVHNISAVQSEYSLWTRLPEQGMIQACEELGVAFVAFSPLARGMLTGNLPDPASFSPRDFRRKNPRFAPGNFERNRAAVAKFEAAAQAMQRTPAELAIAWVLAQSDSIITIPGTRFGAHIDTLAAGAALRLSRAQLADIELAFPKGFPWGSRYAPSQALGVETYD
jgi:aryl-alcohol dehydrogenase-like predicted oxidoreductase